MKAVRKPSEQEWQRLDGTTPRQDFGDAYTTDVTEAIDELIRRGLAQTVMIRKANGEDEFGYKTIAAQRAEPE